jgi:hypothetical protein
MKKLYITATILLSLFAYSCFEDKSEEGFSDGKQVEVQGLDDSYTVYTYQDVLRISPEVADESQYDFCWKVYSTNFNVNARAVPKPDTLSLTKNLNYEVFLDPGKYILVFDVKDKKTAVSKLISINLTVSTLNMTGWYLLKDDGNKTDLDFIYDGGRIDNWIAYYNDGKSLDGKAVKAVYASQFKPNPTSSDLFNTLFVLSESDAAICGINSGKIVMDVNSMFFRTPEIKRFQNVVQPMANQLMYLINDNKVYALTKGALFANPPASAAKISPVMSAIAMVLVFDENTKSMMTLNDNGTYNALGANGNDLKNMNADLVWVGGYAGYRSVAVLLFKKDSGEGYIAKLNATYGFLAGYSSPLITDSKIVPATHGLMSADKIGGNYDSDYFYYAQGNKVYMTDLASLPESLQITLPAGETVTCMQHIKFPQPSSASTVSTVNHFAIASYANGKYKVWIHEISSTGELKPLDQPTFEGNGRVATINYMEQGDGIRVY